MNAGAVLNKPNARKSAVQPHLKDLFIPCPVCRGTLDMTMHGKVICCSCKASWNIRGEPIASGIDDDDEE